MAFRSEYRYTQESVSLVEAQERAHAFLVKVRSASGNAPTPSSWVAGAIWPGHKMSPQGAGLAASKVLFRLEKAGKARYASQGTRRGWCAC